MCTDDKDGRARLESLLPSCTSIPEAEAQYLRTAGVGQWGASTACTADFLPSRSAVQQQQVVHAVAGRACHLLPRLRLRRFKIHQFLRLSDFYGAKILSINRKKYLIFLR